MPLTAALYLKQTAVLKLSTTLTSASLSAQKMDAEVCSALRGGSSHDVLSEGFGLRLTRKDLQTLSNLNWLNDEVSPRCPGGGSAGWVFLRVCTQLQHQQCVKNWLDF